MGNIFAQLLNIFGKLLEILDSLKHIPTIWTATFNGTPVTLVSVAFAYGKPQSKYRVIYVDADGDAHTIDALHDFDGKPADVLYIDGNGVGVPGGDMDIMYLPLKETLRLQFEWDGNRLKLETDLKENPLGQKLIEYV